MRKITPQHTEIAGILTKILKDPGHPHPWRRYTIAVDGVDGCGKSTLSRYLAWQLGMPTIELDLLIDENAQHDVPTLCRLIESRHKRDRPVIVEGVFVLRALAKAGVSVDFLICVEAEGYRGSHIFEDDFRTYEQGYDPKKKADFTFRWALCCD
jgi:hypothetical protein